MTRTDAKGGSRLSGSDFLTADHVFVRTVFLTVDLERKIGITGVPFGRTEVSIPFV